MSPSNSHPVVRRVAGPLLSTLAAAVLGLPALPAWADGARDGRRAEDAAASCLEIHERLPTSASGGYWVGRPGGPAVRVYCDMATDGGGWQVLFNSQNPRRWGRTFGAPGRGEWGVGPAGVPDEIAQLRLMRRDTRERKVIPMTTAALYECSYVDEKFAWNGTKYFTWNAYNLGISTRRDIYPPPEGYVLSGPPCNNDHKSWGFGHRAWIDDRQAWGWDSLDLGPTTFQIAVR